MAKQFCEEHGFFKPCQQCAKTEVWDGEALIFKRNADRRIQELESALREIRDKQGKVCDEYEVCNHPACISSYTSWAIADKALKVKE